MSKFTSANKIDFFNDTIDELTSELVCYDLNRPYSTLEPLSAEQIKRCAWIASILANSDKDEHKEKALAFATLAFTKYKNGDREDIYKQFLYIILSRLDNLPAFDNVRNEDLEQRFEQGLINNYDSVLSSELQSDQNKNRISEDTVLSGFQREIYQYLSQGKDVAISGPTSSGKSFILREYIEKELEKEDDFEAIYVVPTRALITEVSNKLSDRFDDIDIQTGAHFNETDKTSNTFLVVTPERCLNLASETRRENISPSLIFFDEIQNLESGERGVLFENVIESISDYWPKSQIVAAGPYLQNPGRTLSSLTGREVKQVDTKFAPVLQLKVVLEFLKDGGVGNRRHMNAKVYSPSGEKLKEKITEINSVTYSDFNRSMTQSLPFILDEFGEDTKNIIYASRRDYAEDRAIKIADNREEIEERDSIEELVEFLRQSIHEEYSLAECIEKGVAYHHGMVPKIAREEIEDLYRNSTVIDNLVSTPTLLQGVSLPAEKIFLLSDNKGSDDLSSFDFNNLIGRVGRLDTKLYGSIYCVTSEEDTWAEDQFEKTEEKEVEPVTTDATNRPSELIESLTRENIREEEDGALRYTSILLRNRYLKNPQSVTEYLRDNEVNQEDIDRIMLVLEDTLSDIEISNDILKRSPTVDPVLQDELYTKVKRNPENWIVARNKRDFDYDKFETICEELNRIFKFTYDRDNGIDPPENEAENQIGPVVFAANQWLNGSSYKRMIQNRIESERVDDNGVNDSISNLFELVDTDIKFVLVKYFGILTSILEEIEEFDNEWMNKFDQMLDIGSMNFNEIYLISKGVDRSVVVDLPVPAEEEDIEQYLSDNKDRISEFYQKHLKEQGII